MYGGPHRQDPDAELMRTGEDGLWAEDRGHVLYCRLSFRYAVILGPKVFDTQIHRRRFEMYNDTMLGLHTNRARERHVLLDPAL